MSILVVLSLLFTMIFSNFSFAATYENTSENVEIENEEEFKNNAEKM